MVTVKQIEFEESLHNQDEPGILRSRDYFNTLISEQVEKGIKPSRIVLGGFSQGGAMSVFSTITNKEKLGGVFGLSCYLLLSGRIKDFIPEDFPNKKTPVFLAHGLDDEVVMYEYGDKSAKRLKELGMEDVSFHSYEYALLSFCRVSMLTVVQWSRPFGGSGGNRGSRALPGEDDSSRGRWTANSGFMTWCAGYT